jgi:hypothetical protein
MRVAVITPYYKTPRAWLEQCHQSVLAQTHPCTHILVADGVPESYVDEWDAQHNRLATNHGDYGDTPRAIGSLTAIGQGFDAIAYLDADNFYRPGHIESLVNLHNETGAAVCISSRTMHRLDGSEMGACVETDGEFFADTSCLMFTRPAFALAPTWALLDPKLHPICDRMMMHLIRSHNMPRAFTGERTVAFRSSYAGTYRIFGEEPPPEADKDGTDFLAALEFLRSIGGPDLRPRKPGSLSRKGSPGDT